MVKEENILITGSAGFIGFHLWQKLNENKNVIGLDNLAKFSNYDIKLKRLNNIGFNTNNLFISSLYKTNNFNFWYSDLNNTELTKKILRDNKINLVIHLAAATGVRQSITHPEIYTEANILGFNNLIEALHQTGVNNLIYASSSSVYGNDTPVPFTENASCNNPLSYYAVTKKNNELTAQSYAANYNMNIVGLRFFTVYGPWGRPDMANFKFIDAIANNKSFKLFNYGNFLRDFTYVDDIVKSITLLIEKINSGSIYNNEIFNIGSGSPINLKDYVSLLADTLHKKAEYILVEGDKEEMLETYSNSEKLFNEINFKPQTPLKEGIEKSVKWYMKYKMETNE